MAQIQGDCALDNDGEDKLGFGPTADLLAEALAVGTSSHGLVVGVTGRWGSGKSSLINLTQAALRRRVEGNSPYVIEFKPWLVGERDALLQAMFAELVAGIDQIELEAGDATGVTMRKAQRAATALREFAGLLDGAGKVVKASSASIPYVGWLIGLAEDFFQSAAKDKPRSLAASKNRVGKRLRKLNRALVVVIDDVDRLEPSEIVEVLRLVRSVADFPNITYVLSYDEDIVSHAVEVAAQIDDGHSYIEKIVQVTVPIPHPEAFELRRWFGRELKGMSFVTDEEVERRILEIIDQEGGQYLTTPRAVVRTLDSIRFHWAVLDGKVDLTDFIWLQLVKVGNPALYEWVVAYLTAMSARASGRTIIPEEQKVKARANLNAALQREGTAFEKVCNRLADHLPGIVSYHQDPVGGIYEEVPKAEMDRAIGARRLSSPDHYRLYFAFAQPINAPRVGDFEDLNSAIRVSAHEAEALLRQWHSQLLTSGATRAEIMLDRLAAQGLAALTAEEAEHMLMAYANVMDELAGQNINDFGGPDVWRRAMHSLPTLLDGLGDAREAGIRRMFVEGEALSWLTSIFRNETFAHGRDVDRPYSDRVLSSDELDVVTNVMLERYRRMTFDDIMSQPQPTGILYAWQQGGDENGPVSLLAAEVVTDEGLVATLGRLCGRVRTATRRAEREIVTLSRSNIASLIDYESARERVTELAETSQNSALREKSRVLLDSFRNGDRF